MSQLGVSELCGARREVPICLSPSEPSPARLFQTPARQLACPQWWAGFGMATALGCCKISLTFSLSAIDKTIEGY